MENEKGHLNEKVINEDVTFEKNFKGINQEWRKKSNILGREKQKALKQ